MFENLRYYYGLWRACGDLSKVGIPMCSDWSYLSGAFNHYAKRYPGPPNFSLYGHWPLAPFFADDFSPSKNFSDILTRNQNVNQEPLSQFREKQHRHYVLESIIRDLSTDRTLLRVGTGSNANVLAVLLGLQYHRDSHSDSYKSKPKYNKTKVAISVNAHVEMRKQLEQFLGKRLVLFSSLEELAQLIRRDEKIKVVVLNVPSTSTNVIECNEQILEMAKERDIWLHLDCALGIMESLLPTKRAELLKRLTNHKGVRTISVNLHKLVDIEPASIIILTRQRDSVYVQQHYFRRSDEYLWNDGGFYNKFYSLGSTSISDVPYFRAIYKLNQLELSGLRYMHLVAHLAALRLAARLTFYDVELFGDPNISAISVKLGERDDPEDYQGKIANSSRSRLDRKILDFGLHVARIPQEGSAPPGIRIVIPPGVSFTPGAIDMMAQELAFWLSKSDKIPKIIGNWEERRKKRPNAMGPRLFFVDRRYLECIEKYYRGQYLDPMTLQSQYSLKEQLKKVHCRRIPSFVKARARMLGWKIRAARLSDIFPLSS